MLEGNRVIGHRAFGGFVRYTDVVSISISDLSARVGDNSGNGRSADSVTGNDAAAVLMHCVAFYFLHHCAVGQSKAFAEVESLSLGAFSCGNLDGVLNVADARGSSTLAGTGEGQDVGGGCGSFGNFVNSPLTAWIVYSVIIIGIFPAACIGSISEVVQVISITIIIIRNVPAADC